MESKFTHDSVLTLELGMQDLSDLFDVLLFSYETAQYLVMLEETKGSPGGMKKLQTYMEHSKKLMKKLEEVVVISGRPPLDELN
jgi:hypothetical protein